MSLKILTRERMDTIEVTGVRAGLVLEIVPDQPHLEFCECGDCPNTDILDDQNQPLQTVDIYDTGDGVICHCAEEPSDLECEVCSLAVSPAPRRLTLRMRHRLGLVDPKSQRYINAVSAIAL